MDLYSVALFLHILGALALFVALSLEWTGLWFLRHATTAEQAHGWLPIFSLPERFYSFSGATIFLPGIYMMATVWGGVAWIIIALVALGLMILLGTRLSGRRITAIGPAVAAEKGALSPGLRQRLHDPLLWVSIQTRIAIAVGIVFLMTIKPGLAGSLLTIGLAISLGLASAWLLGRYEQSRETGNLAEGRVKAGAK